MRRRFALVQLLALIVVSASVGAASAASKTGCPAGTWEQLTVDTAAETIWPALLDQSPWAGQQDFTAFIDAAFDRNGDDSVCMKTMWGDELNANSHWYQVGFEILGSPAQMFIVRDNNANGG